MSRQLRPIVVSNRSFGMTSGATIFVTSELQEHLHGEGFRGVTLQKLEIGRAFRGFKHLIEMISGVDGWLVLTLGETRKDGDFYHVNLEEYMKGSRGGFHAMYRDVGVTVSSTFLGEHFPSEFDVQDRQALMNQVSQAQRNLDALLDALAQSPRNHPALVSGIVSVLSSISGKRRLPKELSEGLEQLRAAANLDSYKRVLDQLERRLASRRGYPEASGADSWQKWIHRNSWLFGPMYLEPIAWQPVGFRSKPDFIFPTLDGFYDVLEIKKPNHEVLRRVGGHYVWSGATNQAIGQVVAYIKAAEKFRYQLEEDMHEARSEESDRRRTVVRPRGFILIGRDANWDERGRVDFRNLNSALHGVEVLTYDELLRRGRKVVDLYSEVPDHTSTD